MRSDRKIRLKAGVGKMWPAYFSTYKLIHHVQCHFQFLIFQKCAPKVQKKFKTVREPKNLHTPGLKEEGKGNETIYSITIQIRTSINI